ncbi:Calcium-transporting ATPase [Caenorhabditis elegans]|nr:Calcium-transporting ATPase [Caenorhabditis elegans]CAB05000.2 Calcium-transporting ATPase [Caenorhabditis elegans]CAC19895.1 PMR1 protein [Caenorhabditis elegans]CAC19896.1 PMR1 protein [Caenorhabditis elegans]|eukprot:NP_001021860.1 Calcium-transporting ATPase [Caenorhabditis elegans]
MIETLTSEQAASHEVVPCTHQLRTNLEEGLTTAEATRRRQYHGYNEFDVGEEEPIYKKYLEQFQNPLILLLLASAFVSIVMKQYDDAISITVAVVIVVTVGFVQEYRSEKTLEQLTKLVPPTCHVLRDGKEAMMLARELVPGDIVLLNTGDRIPSDLRIAESFSLQIDESSLTGETEPKHKETRSVPAASATGSDVEHLTCIAFMGTLVCAGRGRGIVISTAANSQFGEVVKMMMGEESPKTPLQKSMDDLGKQLSIYSFGVIAVIFLIGMFQGRNVVDMFTIGVSLAVAAIPEGLPIVVAVTLAIGVMRMAKRRAVVKKMPAVETLGCVTVICSDKTGTLTKNEMTAQAIATPEGKLAEITGIGYSAEGGVVQYQGEQVHQWTHPEFARIIEAGLVCNNATIEADKLIGQPTEGAIVVLAKKAQLEGVRSEYKRLREMPFSSDTKWMGVQCADAHGQNVYFIKGALDRVLDQCGTYYSSDNQRKQCDQYSRQHILEIGKELGQKGLRVLGLARGESMQSLMFLGMIGMMDPPRPGAADAISIVKASGVDVKLITGDAMETAQSIGQSLGILSSSDSCLSGQQVDQMSDHDLELVIRQVTVFYRASPRHKLKIVKALQALGEVVAMTGDGVNDAVALKKADIGVAMGVCGTDVCKEAADMILCDDDFSTMTAAIEEGKAIYHNITNFVRFQLSTSVAALSLIAASTMFKFDNPLNAMQILWINIIMDGPPAQSLGVEPVDDDIIRQRPRNTKQPMLTGKLIADILASAAIIVVGTLSVFYKEMSADNKVTPRDTTMTFTCFVLFDMWNALSCRSSRKMIWQIGLRRNRMFSLAVSASLICQLLVIYWAPLQHIFQTEALSLFDLIFLTTITSSVFIFNETRKYFSLRSKSLNHDPLSVSGI